MGGTGPDMLGGGPGRDMLMGDDSEDMVFGRDGDDYLIGGAGADLLYGGPGDDALTDWQPSSLDSTAPADADVLRGGLGADFAGISQGADHVFLGEGDDEVKLADDGAVDTVRCGTGLDSVTYYGAIDPLDGLVDCEDVILAQ